MLTGQHDKSAVYTRTASDWQPRGSCLLSPNSIMLRFHSRPSEANSLPLSIPSFYPPSFKSLTHIPPIQYYFQVQYTCVSNHHVKEKILHQMAIHIIAFPKTELAIMSKLKRNILEFNTLSKDNRQYRFIQALQDIFSRIQSKANTDTCGASETAALNI